MREDLRKVIYDSVKEVFKGKVIWSSQNSPRPGGTFVVLRILSDTDVGMESSRVTDTQGNSTLCMQRSCAMRVEVLGEGAYDRAEELRDSLFLGSIRYRFSRVGAALYDASPVMDTSYIMSEVHIGNRAVFEMLVRHSSVVKEADGLIEHVDTTGSVVLDVDNRVVEKVDLIIDKPGV